jgi:hypothetical protein
VGYLNIFDIFDIGLGRALTKLAADRVAAGRNEQVSAPFWTAFALMLALSLVVGSAMAADSSWLVYHALSVPTALRAESLEALYLLSFSLPLVITMSAFRGMLSALLRFDLVKCGTHSAGYIDFCQSSVGAAILVESCTRCGRFVSHAPAGLACLSLGLSALCTGARSLQKPQLRNCSSFAEFRRMGSLYRALAPCYRPQP